MSTKPAPLTASMVKALRLHRDAWRVVERAHPNTLLALEERGLVESEMRRELPSRPGHETVGAYRWARLTDAGRAYLANLDDLSRVRV